jgi:hypothetical protein
MLAATISAEEVEKMFRNELLLGEARRRGDTSSLTISRMEGEENSAISGSRELCFFFFRFLDWLTAFLIPAFARLGVLNERSKSPSLIDRSGFPQKGPSKRTSIQYISTIFSDS